jgi:hypothetical protein
MHWGIPYYPTRRSRVGFLKSKNRRVFSVIQTVTTNPTNISLAVGNMNLTVSWPADHLDWRLQAKPYTGHRAWSKLGGRGWLNAGQPVGHS